MKKVYFISGLGADKRIFSFLDLSFCEPVFIDWIQPLHKESLPQYALRLREQIKEEHPTLVGISFGGMLATEIAKTNKACKAIIISSNKVHTEFPGYLRIGKYIPVYKWIPMKFLKRNGVGTKWMLGPRGDEQKKLLKQIMSDSDTRFVKWAIAAILNWTNKDVPANLVHIHGTADNLLPCRLVKADHIIENGTHVMTMDKAEEITALLKNLI